MDELRELLEQLRSGAITTDEFLAAIVALDDTQVGEWEEAAQAAFDALRTGDAEPPENMTTVEAATELADAIDVLRDEAGHRIDAATADQDQLDALSERVHAEAEPGEGGEGGGDGGAGEGGDGGEGDGAGTGGGEGEGEGAGEGEGTGDGAEGTAEGAPAEGEPAAVPAASTQRRRPALPRLGRVAARGLPAQRPRPTAANSRAVITAAADVPGFGMGQELGGLEDLAEAFVRRADALRHMAVTAGSSPRYHVATIRAEYPEEQRLVRDAASNEERLRSIFGVDGQQLQAMAASGGLCAPTTPLYDVLTISDDARPAKGALNGFGADRGGVRFIPPPRLGDYTAGVDQWTVANDANPSDPATKPCVRVDCDEEVEEFTYAVTKCLEVGNFFARTYDERVQAILRLLGAEHARLAERLLLDKIGTDSTNVTTSEGLGTVRDTLAIVDRAVAAWHNRHRTPDNYRLELWLPRWWKDMARTDLAREMPGSTAERLAVADAELATFFGVRNVNVTYLMEGETGSGQDFFSTQGAGALNPWPGNVVMYLFHPGAWLFLDGGMLDLGIVRDSTLNETNDLQVWSETFEGAAFRGIESLRIESDVCPSGLTQGAADFDPCGVGS